MKNNPYRVNTYGDTYGDTAQPVEATITIKLAETLPNGVMVLTVDMAEGYMCFPRRSPKALRFNGRLYGRSGWNSDKLVIYYRSDVTPAFMVTS